MSEVKGEQIKYWMYPRVFNTTMYLNHTLLADKDDKLPINVCLYQSDNFVDFGIRIKDVKCYQSLVRILESIKEKHVVDLDSDLAVKPTVSLISEILIADRPLSPRAFAIERFGGLTSGFFPGKFGGFSLGGLGL